MMTQSRGRLTRVSLSLEDAEQAMTACQRVREELTRRGATEAEAWPWLMLEVRFYAAVKRLRAVTDD